jgi:CRISPR/Cas system endoribonuclease Cas6 (RAMP superfamily)
LTNKKDYIIILHVTVPIKKYYGKKKEVKKKLRLKLKFELKKNEIPRDYRPFILSFIKHSVSSYDQTLYRSLYESGAIPKRYTFSVWLDTPSFQSELIQICNNRMDILFSQIRHTTANFCPFIYNRLSQYINQSLHCFFL